MGLNDFHYIFLKMKGYFQTSGAMLRMPTTWLLRFFKNLLLYKCSFVFQVEVLLASAWNGSETEVLFIWDSVTLALDNLDEAS